MRLPYSILEPLIERLRAERLIEVRGGGRQRHVELPLRADRPAAAIARSSTSRSACMSAPAPVPLASYVAYMDALTAARGYMDRERLAPGAFRT